MNPHDTDGEGPAPQETPARVWRARAGLAALVLATAACLRVALTPDPSPPFIPPPEATSDLDFYHRVVVRLRNGEAYHDAAHRELLTLGYPTRSVFNYRTPVYAWFMARLPRPEWGRVLLCGCVLAVVGLWCFELIDDVRLLPAGVASVSLVGALSWCCGKQTYLFTELWAGMLIAMSLLALRRGWTAVGVAAGLVALFARELTLPYVVVCLVMAVWQRRRREALAWALGLLAFAEFLLWHNAMVQARVTAVDQWMPGGWVRFGGLRFILTTAQANVFLMSLPLWVTALYVPLAALGLAAWDGESGRRAGLTGGAYLAAFCVVGAPFNFYWGFMYAPVLALGTARAPGALAWLVHESFPAAAPVRGAVCPRRASAVS